MQKHYYDYWKDEILDWKNFRKESPKNGQLLKVRVNGEEVGYVFVWNDAFEIAEEFTFPSRTVDDIENYEDAYYMVDHYFDNTIEFAVLSKQKISKSLDNSF